MKTTANKLTYHTRYPLTLAGQSALARTLSDLESGTPRQLLWLAVVASLPSPAPLAALSLWRIRLWHLLGPYPVYPWLQKAAPHWAPLYRPVSPRWRDMPKPALMGVSFGVFQTSLLCVMSSPYLGLAMQIAGTTLCAAVYAANAYRRLAQAVALDEGRKQLARAEFVQAQAWDPFEAAEDLSGYLRRMGMSPSAAKKWAAQCVTSPVKWQQIERLDNFCLFAPPPVGIWMRPLFAMVTWAFAALLPGATLLLAPPWGLYGLVLFAGSISAFAWGLSNKTQPVGVIGLPLFALLSGLILQKLI